MVEMARHFRNTGKIVRFIEYMDVGTTNGWRMQEVVPNRDIVEMFRPFAIWTFSVCLQGTPRRRSLP